jgi:hypothetical protein
MTPGRFSITDVEAMLLITLRELLPSLHSYTNLQIQKKIRKEKWEEAICQIVDYIEFYCGTGLSRNEYISLLNHVLTCLITYLRKIQEPIGLVSIVTNIHLLPHSVEQSFPGYASSGLLRGIIYPRELRTALQVVNQ